MSRMLIALADTAAGGASGYRLLWDAARDSTAPLAALGWAAGLLALAGARLAWVALRGGGLRRDGLATMLAVGALLVGAVAAALAYEQRTLGDAARRRVAEGTITGVWHDVTTHRDADRKTRRTYWEGFAVAGVDFVYAMDERDNYWRNRPEQGGPLGEGARVRLHYVERVEDGKTRRRIVRVERAE